MEINEKIDKLIKKEERDSIYYILYIGVSAYKRLLEDNPELEKSKSFSEIRTRILSFVIKRQFEEDVLSMEFPFKVEIKDVNKFKSKALFLNNKLIRLKINKTTKRNTLHNSNKVSDYMLKEAEVNSKDKKQIEMLFFDNNEAEVGEKKHTFMILGYGVRGKEIDHLDFMIPSCNMKKVEEAFNALDEYNQTILMDVNKEQTEKRIMLLKDEAKALVK
ncbi:hypothetical protein CBE01nite_49620 [Clostridium beijerinckii]|jgi:hypothetical protein|uniref:Uncharacterized protein n=2 Tax=Clostridium TaxID=1485 RepID=A0A512TR99_CLOBU|nr:MULTISPECIES: hypothetical protein [Clostridium]MDG5854935.1 hypothetical protein [Clostridium beijerinckii]NOW25280.1 hypothetical protein [Clostridium butyricum]NRZ29520.1 hypothetical protein [Clostridium beijerinckii]NYC00022.1 hypothetical protein [Clostridium beijerinckii]OOM22716.1 hypothetical protein CLBEI_31160 [Clostridium beijerinckii]